MGPVSLRVTRTGTFSAIRSRSVGLPGGESRMMAVSPSPCRNLPDIRTRQYALTCYAHLRLAPHPGRIPESPSVLPLPTAPAGIPAHGGGGGRQERGARGRGVRVERAFKGLQVAYAPRCRCCR
jgi:hypothetical protein